MSSLLKMSPPNRGAMIIVTLQTEDQYDFTTASISSTASLNSKVKVSTSVSHHIAGNLLLKRSGMAMRCQGISQFYLHSAHPSVSPQTE